MIVYNTTFHIDNSVIEEGLVYLKTAYIPKAASGGFLLNPLLRRVIQKKEEEGANFSVQFHVKNIDTLNLWLEKEGLALQKELVKKFGHKVAGFTTLLEEIDWTK